MMTNPTRLEGWAAHSEQDLLEKARGYICYYDNVREYSSFGYQTLFAYLKHQQPISMIASAWHNLSSWTMSLANSDFGVDTMSWQGPG